MRNKILKIKKVFNIIEENITENMLKNADNVFVSNSLIGFVGINKIDNKILVYKSYKKDQLKKLVFLSLSFNYIFHAK